MQIVKVKNYINSHIPINDQEKIIEKVEPYRLYINKYTNQKISHCLGVGLFMYQNAYKNKADMFVLGLLHDIGYIVNPKSHSVEGYKLLFDYKYKDAVLKHGCTLKTSSYELDLLVLANLSVNQKGLVVGYKKRYEGLLKKYREKCFANEVIKNISNRNILRIDMRRI